nr:DNA polymerase III, delta subunit [uncultured bacterium]
MDGIARLVFQPQPSGWPLVGQEQAVKLLRAGLRTTNISHAYMFTGPQGIGKRTTAMSFAMTLLCEAEAPAGQEYPDQPCGICPSCSKVLRGAHPDLGEINLETQAQALADAGGKSGRGPAKELRIDSIREMQSTVGLSPYVGRWKIYIIGDAERMNEEASNALLKTLEEPPRHTIIMLLAPDEVSVLPTIASRCFLVPLREMPRKQIADALRLYWEEEDDQADLGAALAGGRLGYAVALLSDRDGLDRRKKALQELSVLSAAQINDRVNSAAQYAKMFTDSRPELYELLQHWEGWWRDVIAVQSAPELVANVDQLQVLQSSARKYTPRSAMCAITLVQDTRRQLMENVNPRLALESLVLGIP